MSISVNTFYAYLAQQLDAGGSETIVYLDRITTRTGETINTSDFATVGRGVITVNPDGDGNTSFPEYISFTGVSGLTLTGATRGLSARGNNVVAANKRFHSVGTPVVIAFGTHSLQDIFDYIDNEVGALTVGSSMVMSGLAGETVAAGQIVYLKDDGRWWLADADVLASINDVMLGIAQGSGTAGNTITNGILRKGTDSNQSGLTAGANYFVGNTAGAVSATAGTNTRKIGVGRSSTQIYFDPEYAQLPTVGEKAAMAGGGIFGTPSATNKLVTQQGLADESTMPVIRQYLTSKVFGSSTTRFDITNPSGTTFRYTWDGTGTDPVITAANLPIGTMLVLNGQNFNAANNGTFRVTGSGTNYFEVTNASGVAENDKTLGTGSIIHATTWAKPTGLKYVVVQVQGGGGGGNGTGGDEYGNCGSAGGYSEKIIAASALGSTETVTVGAGGSGGTSAPTSGGTGGTSSFGSHCSATGGAGGGGNGGVGSGGDINVTGEFGGAGTSNGGTSGGYQTGAGGSTRFGAGAPASVGDNAAGGIGYGSGGGGAGSQNSTNYAGGAGAPGIVIITEYYS